MKKIILASLIAAASSSSYATDTTALKVQGKLIMAACTPNMSNGGVVDFGSLYVGSMNSTEINGVAVQHMNFTIECGSTVKVGFTTTDNRQDSDAGLPVKFSDGVVVSDIQSLFGFGKTASGVDIGSYSIRIDENNVTIDGVITPILSRDHHAATGWVLSDGILAEGDLRTIAVGSGLMPQSFTTCAFPLTLAATVQPTNILGITDKTELDGEITFSLTYL